MIAGTFISLLLPSTTCMSCIYMHTYIHTHIHTYTYVICIRYWQQQCLIETMDMHVWHAAFFRGEGPQVLQDLEKPSGRLARKKCVGSRA